MEVPNSGGGDRFLDFFARELIPYVEANYRTAPYRVFAGHSFGGLLALHILATRPDMFGALIAASPSLNWDKEYPTRVVESLLKGRKELSRTLFVSMANEEDGEGHPTRLERLEAILKANRPAGFVWEAKLMADEDHGSVVLRSHYWGLRRVFDGWRMPLDVRRGEGDVVAAVKTHYAALSRRMGYEVLPPEGTVNQLGYQVLGRGKVEDAITVFRYNVELYPASANVHDSLGEALERAGRKEEALASYSRAVQNATATGDPLLEVFTRNRDRLSK
ncbi:MAG: alpha/beta hydrolase-fold protein [Thermoanaerobaculaceae bacterium]